MEEKNLFFHCTHAADENGAKKKKKWKMWKDFSKNKSPLSYDAAADAVVVGGEINNCAWAVDYKNSIPHL